MGSDREIQPMENLWARQIGLHMRAGDLKLGRKKEEMLTDHNCRTLEILM
jgi:hypothetical protein